MEDPAILERVDFYAQDLRILRDLGFEVTIATSPRDLRPADLYFGWWWTWGAFPAVWGSLRRTPVILTGVFDAWAWPQRSLAARAMHRLALRRATANVFISRLEAEGVPRDFGPVRRPEYCPLTVDTERYAPAGRDREPFLLCIAGSGMHNGNSRRKCLPELLEAFAMIRRAAPELELRVVGRTGSDYPGLAALVRQLGLELSVHFHGVVTVEEKIDLLQRCSMYLQPTRFEGFGLSILEAMSCGACVVTSPVGAVPELVGDAAMFVDGADSQAIASAVLELWSAPERRRRLERDARERASAEFRFERRLSFFRALTDELVSP